MLRRLHSTIVVCVLLLAFLPLQTMLALAAGGHPPCAGVARKVEVRQSLAAHDLHADHSGGHAGLATADGPTALIDHGCLCALCATLIGPPTAPFAALGEPRLEPFGGPVLTGSDVPPARPPPRVLV